MSKMIKDVSVPRYFKGFGPTKKGYPNKIKILGGDTETFRGEPLSFQLCGEDRRPSIEFVNSKTITDEFLAAVKELLTQKNNNQAVIFFHNLGFDLPVLFFPYKDYFSFSNFRLKIDMGTDTAVCDILCGKTFYARIKFKTAKAYVRIIDSSAFLTGSLASIADTLKLDVRKQAPPAGLGEVLFTPNDRDFVSYAKNDALVGFLIGEYIMAMHKEYDVPPSLSIAQLAQRVFTKNFMREGEFVYLPPKKISNACVKSYHGGKNGFYLPGPCMMRNVYELDVVSMYPHAMVNLPPFTMGEYEYLREFDFKDLGVWCISGVASECKYPVIFSHDFKPIRGRFKNVWVNSYEIVEGLNSEELSVDECRGFVFRPDPRARNPFKDYVDHFFELKKSTPKSDKRRLMYKLLLNSLYGKFIQNVDYREPVDGFVRDDMSIDWVARGCRAGGLFNPFIATAITAYARAYLHRLEHRFEALHSSTDSIKTVFKPEPCLLGSDLGDLSVDAFGDCLFLRNKLYVHFDERIKSALHGFAGSTSQLLRMFLNRDWSYSYPHMTKIRESLKLKSRPFVFREVEACLKL